VDQADVVSYNCCVNLEPLLEFRTAARRIAKKNCHVSRECDQSIGVSLTTRVQSDSAESGAIRPQWVVGDVDMNTEVVLEGCGTGRLSSSKQQQHPDVVSGATNGQRITSWGSWAAVTRL